MQTNQVIDLEHQMLLRAQRICEIHGLEPVCNVDEAEGICCHYDAFKNEIDWETGEPIYFNNTL